jgi:hypothetical protein
MARKKKTKSPSAEEVRAAVMHYFDDVHFTLWPSGGWDISQSDRRELAADWATAFFLEVHDKVHNNKEK